MCVCVCVYKMYANLLNAEVGVTSLWASLSSRYSRWCSWRKIQALMRETEGMAPDTRLQITQYTVREDERTELMRGKRRKFTTKFISALFFGIYHQNGLTFFIKPLWMEVMVFSRYRRAVGRDRGELDPAIVLEVFILEQPRPGRLGTSSPSAALSPGLQITELDLQQEKRT